MPISIRELWKNFLYSGIAENIENFHRLEYFSKLRFINISFLIGFFALTLHGTMYAVSLFGKNNHYVMIISYLVATSLIIEIILMRIKPHLKISINLLLVIHLTFSIFLILDGGIYLTGILWITSFPVLLYYLKGKKVGNLWVFFVGLILLAICFASCYSILPAPYTPFQIFAALVLLITISVLIVFYEESKAKSLNLAIYQLSHDLFTGLPNRAQLISDINKATEGTLVRIDIQNLTDISSVFGFEYGINVLKRFVEELKIHVQKAGEIYLFTNDEIAIFLYEEAYEKIDRMMKIILDNKTYKEAIQKKFNVDLHIIAGVSYMSSNDKSELIASAELALKMAIDQRSMIFHCNNPGILRSKFQDNINWSVLVRNALESDQILPFFQPIQNNRTGQIDKFESLLRMKTLDDKIIKPEHFLDISKKTDMYYQLTRIMIEKTFAFFEKLTYNFSINLSIKDIYNRDLNQFIIQKLKRFARPESVIFEITESESIQNYDEINRFIKRIKRYGSQIAIDDFGSGYSNFNHIVQMDIDFIKLDASLIRPIVKDKNSEIMIQSIIHFAQKINVQTIAEYVANQKIYNKVIELGIDFSQGYYVGKPVGQLSELDLN